MTREKEKNTGFIQTVTISAYRSALWKQGISVDSWTGHHYQKPDSSPNRGWCTLVSQTKFSEATWLQCLTFRGCISSLSQSPSTSVQITFREGKVYTLVNYERLRHCNLWIRLEVYHTRSSEHGLRVLCIFHILRYESPTHPHLASAPLTSLSENDTYF